MLKRLYNPWQIANSGERETDRRFSHLPDDETFYIIHGMRISSRFHPNQSAGECDFVIMTRLGLVAVEVKGGEICYGEREDGSYGFYRSIGNDEEEPVQNPFMQVDSNADAIQKFLLDKGQKNIFVGRLVCFPECEFERDGIGDDFLWHRGSSSALHELILEAMEEQIAKFRQNEKARGLSKYVVWRELEEDDMELLCRTLEPEFSTDLYRTLVRLNIAESDRRINEGIAALSGLNENLRIMVQGPPGSGKSTYAFETIRRLCCNEGKTGLYICWNELLCAEMQSRLSDPDEGIPREKIQAKLFFDIVADLIVLSGGKRPDANRANVEKLRELMKGAVAKCSSKKYERYDFLVIDEAQDIFDKGLDYAIKALLKGNNPLQHGNYSIFYDDSQDYPTGGDLGSYVRTRDMLKTCSASYNLTSALRVNTGNGIEALIRDAATGTFDPAKSYGKDVIIRQLKDPGSAPGMIKTILAGENGLSGIECEDCLVLFTSALLKDTSPFPSILQQDQNFAMLTAADYRSFPRKIRYTTMLKSKGLERDVVVLMVGTPLDPRSQFEIFIGASRARCRVYLIC